MRHNANAPGQFMASELDQAAAVFARTAVRDLSSAVERTGLKQASAIYTIARGSSDAAASILAYEVMREWSVPTTSLPPSVFSVGQGVSMRSAVGLVVSQSGASDDLVRATAGMRQAGSNAVIATAFNETEYSSLILHSKDSCSLEELRIVARSIRSETQPFCKLVRKYRMQINPFDSTSV